MILALVLPALVLALSSTAFAETHTICSSGRSVEHNSNIHKICDSNLGERTPIVCVEHGSTLTCRDVDAALGGSPDLLKRFKTVPLRFFSGKAEESWLVCPETNCLDLPASAKKKWRGVLVPRIFSKPEKVSLYDATLFYTDESGSVQRRKSWACSDTPPEFLAKPDLVEWKFEKNLLGQDASPTTVFTDAYLPLAAHVNTTGRKVALLLEPPNVYPESYRFARNFAHIFDTVLTFDARLVAHNPSLFTYYPHGGMCAGKVPGEGLVTKTRHVSIIASKKKITNGHRLRHAVVSAFGKGFAPLEWSGISVDVYGRGYDREIRDRADAFRSYKYAIIIENSRIDGYHTEKLIECLSFGTVPIYWGGSSAIRLFNSDGIIPVSSFEDIAILLGESGPLGDDDFASRRLAIKENIERARMHAVPEDFIFRHTEALWPLESSFVSMLGSETTVRPLNMQSGVSAQNKVRFLQESMVLFQNISANANVGYYANTSFDYSRSSTLDDCINPWDFSTMDVYFGPAVFEKALLTPYCDKILSAASAPPRCSYPTLEIPVWISSLPTSIQLSAHTHPIQAAHEFCENAHAVHGINMSNCAAVEKYVVNSMSRMPASWAVLPHCAPLQLRVFESVMLRCRESFGLVFRPPRPLVAYQKTALAIAILCEYASLAQQGTVCTHFPKNKMEQIFDMSQIPIIAESLGESKEDAAIAIAAVCEMQMLGRDACAALFASHADNFVESLQGLPGIASSPFHFQQSYYDWMSACRATAESTLLAVTAADAAYFDRLRNLVGSIHIWEPSMCIEVYDLGMSRWQLEQLAAFANVHIRKLGFDVLPGHVSHVPIFAWKPVAMRDSLRRLSMFRAKIWAQNNFTLPALGIFYTDPSIEYRQSIGKIKAKIASNGYFYVHQEGMQTHHECCGPISELTMVGTISEMQRIVKSDAFAPPQIPENAVGDVPDGFMCAGGIQGYKVGDLAVRQVLDAVVKCAVSNGGKCIAPPGHSKSVHRYDQSAFSLAIYYQGKQCERDRIFWAYHFLHRVTENELESNAVVLLLRRWSGPYAKWAHQALPSWFSFLHEKAGEVRLKPILPGEVPERMVAGSNDGRVLHVHLRKDGLIDSEMRIHGSGELRIEKQVEGRWGTFRDDATKRSFSAVRIDISFVSFRLDCALWQNAAGQYALHSRTTFYGGRRGTLETDWIVEKEYRDEASNNEPAVHFEVLVDFAPRSLVALCSESADIASARFAAQHGIDANGAQILKERVALLMEKECAEAEEKEE